MAAYTFAENIKSVLLDNLSQFEYDDAGANLGIGYTGWDSALAYARDRGLDVFGAIMLALGDDQDPKAFGYGMWQWTFYIRIHVRFDVTASPTPDESLVTLADDIINTLLDPTNVRVVTPTGGVKISAINYMGDPADINDVTYLTMEMLVTVKDQIAR